VICNTGLFLWILESFDCGALLVLFPVLFSRSFPFFGLRYFSLRPSLNRFCFRFAGFAGCLIVFLKEKTVGDENGAQW
jgi:hypothetical protein